METKVIGICCLQTGRASIVYLLLLLLFFAIKDDNQTTIGYDLNLYPNVSFLE